MSEDTRQDNRRNDERVDLAEIKTKLDYISKELDDIYEKLEKNYVTQDQFALVRTMAWGLMSATGLALMAAILGFFIKKPV